MVPKASLNFIHHLMKYILILIMTVSIGIAYGQGFAYPSIKSTGQSIIDFVPAGWTILDSAYGDLNKDGTGDAAVIIQHKNKVSLINSVEDTVLTQPRILLVLFKEPADNSFLLSEQSNSFILKQSIISNNETTVWRCGYWIIS